MDANSKLGPSLIPGDKHPQSDNGRILADIIDRHGLLIGNALPRVTKFATEESTIDFVLLSADLLDETESILVDDKRLHVLTKLRKNKSGVVKVESDHNPIISKFKIQWKAQLNQQRIEVFNLKNRQCQEMFKRETSSSETNGNLSATFDQAGDLNNQTVKFLKKLEKTIYKCFKKIRIKERVDKEKENLFKKWRSLKNKNDEKSKAELKKVEKELSDKYADEYFEKIKKQVGNIDCLDGNMNSGSLWNLKKDLFPQSRDPPTAMIDPVTGNLLTDEKKIQDAALHTYSKRLENRPIKKNLEHVKDAKEKLCEKLLEVARANKTPDWEMKHLDRVLKQLKKNKSRDPLGFCNELFRPEVAGDDL